MSETPLAVVDDVGHPRRWAILVVLCTSLATVMIANASLNMALPAISRELHASTSDLQWIVDSYSLVFAGLLFTAGALGDRFGRKGALQLGLAIFLAATIAGAMSSSSTQVILFRAVMGLGAAFVMPATLSIIVNVFPVHERAKAIAIWTGIAGAGGSLGPIASGFLLEHFSWSSVFLVNIPIVVVALVAGARLLPRSRDENATRIDVLGSILSFVAWELHTPTPMLEMRWFKDRSFSVGSTGMGLTFFALFGMMFLVTQYLQLVIGYSALNTAIRMLPIAAVMVIVSPQAPRLVHRFGANRVVGGGLAVVAVGAFLLSRLGVDSGYWTIFGAFVVMVSGMSVAMAPLTNAIMSGVPRDRAGVGSAMNDVSRELGGSLGVAVMGSILTSQYASSLASTVDKLPASARAAADSSLAGALGVASQLGEGGNAIAAAAKQAFVDGMSIAFIVGAVVVAIAAIVSGKLLPTELDEADHAGVDGPAAVEVDTAIDEAIA
jgi:MFS family permease